MTNDDMNDAEKGERIAKVLARAGIASRREAERLIAIGAVAVNGRAIDSPALNIGPKDRVTVNGRPVAAAEPPRMWLYYKPLGLVTSERDEKGRETVFETLPPDMPRVVSVGRLDLNSEGLLLLTNDGEIKRRLELPSTGWLRKYRVRVNGTPEEAALEPLRQGIEIEGERFQPMQVVLDRQQGANAWLTVGLREGRNREIRRAMDAVGLTVNRLIRLSYGPFKLDDMEPGEVREIKARVLREQLGLKDETPEFAVSHAGAKARPKPARPAGPKAKAAPRRGAPDLTAAADPSASLRRAAPAAKARAAGSRSHQAGDRPAEGHAPGARPMRTGADRATEGRGDWEARPERPDRGFERPKGDAPRAPRGGFARGDGPRPERGPRGIGKPRFGRDERANEGAGERREGGAPRRSFDRPERFEKSGRFERSDRTERSERPDRAPGERTREDRPPREGFAPRKPGFDRPGRGAPDGERRGDAAERGPRRPYENRDERPQGDRKGGFGGKPPRSRAPEDGAPPRRFGAAPGEKPAGRRFGDRSKGDWPAGDRSTGETGPRERSPGGRFGDKRAGGEGERAGGKRFGAPSGGWKGRPERSGDQPAGRTGDRPARFGGKPEGGKFGGRSEGGKFGGKSGPGRFGGKPGEGRPAGERGPESRSGTADRPRGPRRAESGGAKPWARDREGGSGGDRPRGPGKGPSRGPSGGPSRGPSVGPSRGTGGGPKPGRGRPSGGGNRS